MANPLLELAERSARRQIGQPPANVGSVTTTMPTGELPTADPLLQLANRVVRGQGGARIQTYVPIQPIIPQTQTAADTLLQLAGRASVIHSQRANYFMPGVTQSPGFWRGLYNAFMRGYESARITKNILEAPIFGSQAEDIADAVRKRQELAPSEYLRRFNEAHDWWDALKALPAALPEIAAEAMGTYITQAPLISTAAVLGGPVGMGVAAGLSSGVIEYANKIIESLQQIGVDVTDPASLRAAFEDPQKMQEFRSKALEKAVPVAVLDAIGAGIAGRLFGRPVRKIAEEMATNAVERFVRETGTDITSAAARRVYSEAFQKVVMDEIGKATLKGTIGRTLGETAIQAGLGATGETLGELAAGEKLSPASILAEAGGQILPALHQIGLGAAGRLQRVMTEGVVIDTPKGPVKVGDVSETPNVWRLGRTRRWIEEVQGPERKERPLATLGEQLRELSKITPEQAKTLGKLGMEVSRRADVGRQLLQKHSDALTSGDAKAVTDAAKDITRTAKIDVSDILVRTKLQAAKFPEGSEEAKSIWASGMHDIQRRLLEWMQGSNKDLINREKRYEDQTKLPEGFLKLIEEKEGYEFKRLYNVSLKNLPDHMQRLLAANYLNNIRRDLESLIALHKKGEPLPEGVNIDTVVQEREQIINQLDELLRPSLGRGMQRAEIRRPASFVTKFVQWVRDLWDRKARILFDEGEPLRHLSRLYKQASGEELNTSRDPHIAFQYYKGYASAWITEAVMGKGPLNAYSKDHILWRDQNGEIRTDENGIPIQTPSLREIFLQVERTGGENIDHIARGLGEKAPSEFRPLKHKQLIMEAFAQYLVGRRALAEYDEIRTMIKEGRQVPESRYPGIDETTAKEWVDKWERVKGFNEAAEALYAWQRAVLKYIGDVAPKTYGWFVERLQSERDYVPLARVFEWGELSTRGIYRFGGSERDIVEVFPQIIYQSEALVSAAHRAHIAELVVALRNNPDMASLIKEMPTEITKEDLDIAERSLMMMGIDTSEMSDNELAAFASSVGIGRYKRKANEPIIYVREGDRLKAYRVPKEVYAALTSVDVPKLHPFISYTFGTMARVFRMAATGVRLGFNLWTNPWRDFQTYMNQVRSAGSAKELLGYYFEALRQATRRKGPLVEAFYAMGLNLSNYLGPDIATANRTLRHLTAGKLRYLLVPSQLANEIREAIGFTERVPRMAAILAAAKDLDMVNPDNPIVQPDGTWRPLTRDEWVYIARAGAESTVDFRQMGTLSKVLNQVIPFFNANIQGARFFTKRFKEDPARALVWGVSTITIPALLQYATNAGESWFDDMPDRERLVYLHFKIPGTKETLRVPLAFEWGAMFGVVPIVLFDMLRKEDPAEFWKAIDHIVSITNPFELPPPLRVLWEQATNKIEFWNRAIVPEGERYLEPEQQYGPYTTEFAKWLARQMPDFMPEWFRSPRRIDSMLYELFAGTGPGIVRAVENVAGWLRSGEGGKREPSQWPFVGVIFGRGGQVGASSKSINELYQIRNKLLIRNRADAYRPLTPDQQEYLLKLETAVQVLSALRYLRNRATDAQRRRELFNAMRRVAMNALKNPPDLEKVGEIDELRRAAINARRALTMRRSLVLNELIDRYLEHIPNASFEDARKWARSQPEYRMFENYSRRITQLANAKDIEGINQLVQQIESGVPTASLVREKILDAWVNDGRQAALREAHRYYRADKQWGSIVRELWGSGDAFLRQLRGRMRMRRAGVPPEIMQSLFPLADEAAKALMMGDRHGYLQVIARARELAESAGLNWVRVLSAFVELARERQATMEAIRTVAPVGEM